MSFVLASFKLPSLPISIKIPVAPLQIVYICMAAISPNLSLVNFLFASLVVAWLLDATETSKNIEIFHATTLAFISYQRVNNEGADHAALMHSLVCAFCILYAAKFRFS